MCVWQRERERGLIVTSWFHHWLPVLPLGKGNRNAWLPAPHLKSRGISAVSSLLLLLEAVWLRCPELLSRSGQRALCLSPRCEGHRDLAWPWWTWPQCSCPFLCILLPSSARTLPSEFSLLCSVSESLNLSFLFLSVFLNLCYSKSACLSACLYLSYLSIIYLF